MVEEQRDVQSKRDPLSGTHEHQAEEPVDGVLWYHQLSRTDTGSQAAEINNHASATGGGDTETLMGF